MNDSNESTGRDRRLQPRALISVDVDIETAGNFYRSKTRDISTGGVFVETDAPLPIGAEIVLRMRLQRRHYLAIAQVVWQLADPSGRPVGVGARFVNAPRSMRGAIDEFVRLRQPIEFEEPADGDCEPGGPAVVSHE